MNTIPLKQSTNFLLKEVTFNKKVVFGTAKTLAQLVQGNLGIATNEFFNTLDSMGLSENPSELAWELVFKCLYKGVENLLIENKLLQINEVKTETHEVSTLAFQITEYLNQGNQSINQDFLVRPNQASVITNFNSILQEWLESIGVEQSDINNFANRYTDYVGLAFCDIWRSNDKYKTLLDNDTPASHNAREIMNWQMYRQKLQHVVQTPVFNETISLQQLFIELRASYLNDDEADTNFDSKNMRTHERNKKHQVVMLNEYIEQWYNQDDKKDAVRLLCGGPGSGKSSSAKIIASNFASNGERVVFLPLHLLEFNDTFDDVIDKHLSSVDRLGMPLFKTNDFEKTLVIFDGLDELAMKGKQAENDAKAFVSWLKAKIESLNETKLRIKALVTGRDVVIQQQDYQFRKPYQILHLLPYMIKDNDKYINSDAYINIDQREQWWQNFGTLKGWDKTDIPDAYTQGKLGDITSQPLLNYLVALHHINNNQILDKDTNLNVIYRELIRNVYKRSWGEAADPKHPANKKLTQLEFEQVLQLVAVSAWHGSGRTTTENEVVETFKKLKKSALLEKFHLYRQDASDNKLTQLLTAFYFKKVGSDKVGNNTFEFTHKSFEEYLVAKQLVSFLIRLPDMTSNEDMEEETILLKWIDLTGTTALNNYYFDFLIDEIKLLHKNNLERLKHIHTAIVELFNYVIKHDLPMHQCSQLTSYQERKKQARNSKDALLACMGYLSKITETTANIKFNSSTDFSNVLREINLQRTTQENSLACSHLTYLNLNNQVFDYSDMCRFDVSKSSLINGSLQFVYLHFANLREANLRKANLRGADLRGAYLIDANLTGADLIGADLIGAYLIRANLAGANLNSANLNSANLNSANLAGADLTGAKLNRADLTGADLTGADLTGADLTGADLTGADLTGADLTGVDLTNARNYKLKK